MNRTGYDGLDTDAIDQVGFWQSWLLLAIKQSWCRFGIWMLMTARWFCRLLVISGYSD